ncbi:hypothetical protein CDAR_460061, partial [Caerostris darwini]
IRFGECVALWDWIVMDWRQGVFSDEWRIYMVILTSTGENHVSVWKSLVSVSMLTVICGSTGQPYQV